MREVHDTIISPLVTEKSTTQREGQNQYSFMVDKRANKIEIKEAVERLFKVKDSLEHEGWGGKVAGSQPVSIKGD